MKRARNVVDLVVARLPPPGGKKGDAARARPAYEDKGDEEMDDGIGYESAFNDLTKAIKSGDTKAGVEALRDFVDMCRHAPAEEEEPDEDDEG